MMLKHKKHICEVLANYYWKNYLAMDNHIKDKTKFLGEIPLYEMNQKFDELMLDKTKKEILEWQNYKELAVYYARLSKSKFRLFLTPKSKLEEKLEEAKREYYSRRKANASMP